MPLFDPTIIPAEGLTSDFIEGVNGVVDRLRAMKVDSLSVAGAVRTHNLVRCYIQAHIRRCITYIEAGHAAFYDGRTLVTDACARANYENVAAFCDFANALIPLLDAGDHESIRAFVGRRAFATKVPQIIEQHGEVYAPTNIVTLVNKMKKKYPEFRAAYDYLSDSVHPNGLGAVVHFVDINYETGIATFHESGKNPNWALISLVGSGFILAFLEVAIGDIEQHLEKLSGGH